MNLCYFPFLIENIVITAGFVHCANNLIEFKLIQIADGSAIAKTIIANLHDVNFQNFQ